MKPLRRVHPQCRHEVKNETSALKQASSAVILHLNGAKKLYCKLTLLKRYSVSRSSRVFACALRHKSFSPFIIHLFGNVEEKRGNLFRSEFVLLKHSTINKLYIFLLGSAGVFWFPAILARKCLNGKQGTANELRAPNRCRKERKSCFSPDGHISIWPARHFPLLQPERCCFEPDQCAPRKVVPIGLMSDG